MSNATAHTQSPIENEIAASGSPVVPSDNVNASTPSPPQNDDNCMKMLIIISIIMLMYDNFIVHMQ